MELRTYKPQNLLIIIWKYTEILPELNREIGFEIDVLLGNVFFWTLVSIFCAEVHIKLYMLIIVEFFSFWLWLGTHNIKFYLQLLNTFFVFPVSSMQPKFVLVTTVVHMKHMALKKLKRLYSL